MNTCISVSVRALQLEAEVVTDYLHRDLIVTSACYSDITIRKIVVFHSLKDTASLKAEMYHNTSSYTVIHYSEDSACRRGNSE